MLGGHIDYKLLRPFTHSRNLATEEDLDGLWLREETFPLEHALLRLEKFVRRVNGHLPISPDLSYLDIGCGCGDISIALAHLGAGRVTGVDMMPRNISRANMHLREIHPGGSIEFVCADIFSLAHREKFDIVISHEALEHIDRPRPFLSILTSFLRPGGKAILGFGPLFHSPLGDHMSDFFRVTIPWRGVLFSEKAILRLRAERFRPTEHASSFSEIRGGLNRMRYSEFLRYVEDAGLAPTFLTVNPQLKRWRPVFHVSNALVRIPVLQDFLASSVYAVLQRTGDAS